MIEPLFSSFGRTPFAQDLVERLPGASGVLRLSGLSGSSGAVMVAWLAERFPQRILAVVAATPAEAERWLADLAILTGQPIALYPQREGLGETEPHFEIAGERIETLEALLRGQLRILVTTARASAEKTPMPDALEQLRLPLQAGKHHPLSELITRLEAMGYRRVPVVTEVAEFSVRGGIVDLYGFGMAAPTRLEWWGDDISSMRSFDLTNQRSGEEIREVTVLPLSVGREKMGSDSFSAPSKRSLTPFSPTLDRKTLLDLLPADTLVFEETSHPNAEEVLRAWKEAEHHLDIARRLGESPLRREELFAEPEQLVAVPNPLPPGAPPGRATRPPGRLPSARAGRPEPGPAAGDPPGRARPSSCATTPASSSGSTSCSTRGAGPPPPPCSRSARSTAGSSCRRSGC